MPITRLDPTTVNRIAAGEVVERPASVVKELIENALDAGAARIEVATAGGGRTLLRVTDDGLGIPVDELPLALERHCTSKLDHDLIDVRTLGFRGEALPSIGSVARLTLRSRARGTSEGAEMRMDGGAADGPVPAPGNEGTVVEVRDLFHATPARLKFLRGERAEGAAIMEVVRHAALAHPHVRFALTGPDRRSAEWGACHGEGAEALARRIGQVLGEEFRADTVPVEAEREGVLLTGFAGLPAHNRGNAGHQFLFVNGRPVRDKQLLGALRGAYGDLVPKGRHPVAVLFLDCPPGAVDVNVHPQKAEVRFRDAGLVRGLIVGAVREALAASDARRGTATLGTQLLGALHANRQGEGGVNRRRGDVRGTSPDAVGSNANAPASDPRNANASGNMHASLGDGVASADGFAEATQAPFVPAPISGRAGGKGSHAEPFVPEPSARAEAPDDAPIGPHPLGAARAQLHECFIVAQTEGGIVLVDQHAAHERLVMEGLKKGMAGRAVPSQMLLIPEIVSLSPDDADALERHAPALAKLGLEIERFGDDAVAVQATPAMLGEVDASALVRDLADEVSGWDASGDAESILRAKLDRVVATIACHGSVRAGRRMSVPEMNALLRQIEQTPGAEVCNHGRPTFIELALKDLERLFGR